MITLPSLTAALQALGNATVFVGNPLVAGQMTPLGQKEGEAQEEIEEEYSDLTAPELTGPTVHESILMGVNARVTVPIIVGDPLLYAKISPTGVKGGGWSNPQAIVPTTVLLVPNKEVGGGLSNTLGTTASWDRAIGNGVAAARGAAAAPAHALWLWRCRVSRGGRGFTVENGGKVIVEVTFQAMFDSTMPEGQKVYTVGDPAAQGITTIRI